jgi:hypothetical protein
MLEILGYIVFGIVVILLAAIPGYALSLFMQRRD